jgi:uncharacterized protein (DUF924 family)
MNDTNSPPDPRAAALLDAWFGTANDGGPALQQRMATWFAADAAWDAELQSRFGGLVAEAARGALAHWSTTPRGRLALILVLDQLPRNCFRGRPDAFATDAAALAETQAGVRRGDDRALTTVERLFFYMPLQHAEDAGVQQQAVECFRQLAAAAPAGDAAAYESALEYARLHRDIVLRFGRFPHRNRILQRESTPEELAWLAAGAPDFGQK